MKILNIYGQEEWHTEARIIGNSEGLQALKQTINDALRVISNKATTAEENNPLFASDGEGYEVIVECNDDKFGLAGGKDSFWNKEESNPQYIFMERQNALFEANK